VNASSWKSSRIYETQARMVGVLEKMKSNLIELRVGTRQKTPKAVSLKAGALTADFVAGGLRTIRYEGHEVLRAIAYVVRDQNWGTYHPEISECLIDKNKTAFTITYRARCTSADAAQILTYQASITGNSQGHLSFYVTAEPMTPFLTARCGFAVLHPISGVAGQEAVVEHVDGAQEQATFPDLISPAQPFKDIRAIQHWVTPGIKARCVLNGDVFEMEDQRNWSDASFKTYVRPLSLPWPYVMEHGVINRQSVELTIERSPGSHHGPARKEEGAVRVTVAGPDGTFPGIGVSVHPDLIPQALAHPGLLNSLRPQLLLFHFAPTKGHGHHELCGFSDIASRASNNTESILELVLPAQQSVHEELFGVADMVAASGLRLSGILVSPAVDLRSTLPGSPWPACPPLNEIYQAAREAFPGLAIGGGSLSFFTELNRKRPPVELLDFVSHCTCPIVHAADDLSVMESLEALPHIARSTRAFIGQDKAYRIGPSTLGMRHNPYGARVMDNPANFRIAMTDRDPRQTSLFAAAWLIGYAAATAEAGLQSLTVGSLTDRLGLASAPVKGELLLHPAFYAARGLAELGGHPRYQCQSSRPGCVAAVAGLDGEGRRVAWLANLTGKKQEAVVEWVGAINSVMLLDEQSLRAGGAEPWREWTGASSIQLLPYSLACLRYAAPLAGE
jgi:D-apionolactonase